MQGISPLIFFFFFTSSIYDTQTFRTLELCLSTAGFMVWVLRQRTGFESKKRVLESCNICRVAGVGTQSNTGAAFLISGCIKKLLYNLAAENNVHALSYNF